MGVEKWKKHKNPMNTTICGGRVIFVDRYGYFVVKNHPQMMLSLMWINLPFLYPTADGQIPGVHKLLILISGGG